MSRPTVSVVVPFAGRQADAERAAQRLRALAIRTGDELILADNSDTVPALPAPPTVVRAPGERSPAHARNAGASRSSGDWILFLDADTVAPSDLLDRYFASPVGGHVGALAGEIRPAPGDLSLASRYAARRNFLSARAHLAHPYRPRAAAANLMVRRSAFMAAGGFREGVRTAEDTDLCWRLQDLGWTLELRPDAIVEHQYRTSVRELAAQWRAYAAGRAWLAREYPGFHPEPAAKRALRRVWRAGAGPRARPGADPGRSDRHQEPSRSDRKEMPSRAERLEFLALDVLLAVEELVGMRLPNRPREGGERS